MALKSLSTAYLRRELARRERGAGGLTRQRLELQKKLAALDRQLADLGVSNPSGGPKRRGGRRGRRPRSKNKLTLADALASNVRVGTVVSPAEAAKRVRAAGYKTGSKTFGIQVATTLAKHKAFKRKGRGQYERVA